MNEKTVILESYKRSATCLETILKHSVVEDEVSVLSEAEYEKYPLVLPLAECFLEKDIRLTYEEYHACIGAAENYKGRPGICESKRKLSVQSDKDKRFSQYPDHVF